ncbi:hypothetical protein B0H13DRAFT_2307546 [Mycena leptocephala]|nr:hypothetical protein B0H13DRAFT_2307546 [Mycena leptocephala]
MLQARNLKAKSEDSHDTNANAKSTSKASDSATKGGAATNKTLLSALITSDAAPELEAHCGPCGDLKEIACDVVKGLNGYGFPQCASPKKVEAKAIVAYNRAKIVTLTEKSSSVFSVHLSS